METQFVPYELAVKLKELGFEGSSLAYYESNGEMFADLKVYHSKYIVKGTACLAPLWQQAFDFILSKINLQTDYNSQYVLTFDGEFSLEYRQYFPHEGMSLINETTGNYETLKKLIEKV